MSGEGPGRANPPARRLGEAARRQREEQEARIRQLHRDRVPGEPFRSPFARVVRRILWSLALEERAQRNFERIHARERAWELGAKGPPAAGESSWRLLHASDFHLDFRPDLPDRLAARTRETGPVDATVLTGDFFDLVFREDRLDRGLLRALVEVFPAPRFAVLGNHDILAVGDLLESLGVQVLMNEGVELPAGTGARQSLWVAGIDDARTFATDSLASALDQRAPSQPCVLLSHSPHRYRQAARAGVDLYLCGHTHGGQMAPPWPWMPGPGGGLSVARRSGPWRWRRMQGYTSNGCGGCKLPYRLNAPAEVVVHQLRSPAPEKGATAPAGATGLATPARPGSSGPGSLREGRPGFQ